MNRNKRNVTNNFKLVYLPLLFTLFSVFAIAFFAHISTQRALIHQMEQSGEDLALLLSRKIESEIGHFNYINEVLERNLLIAGKAVLAEKDYLNNERLRDIRDFFEVHEIFWYSNQGEVLFSSSSDYIGWKVKPGDPIDQFMTQSKEVFVEDIRKATENDEYFKFAYLRDDEGSFVQVGYRAEYLNLKTDKYKIQTIVERIANNDDNILYALFIDENLIAIADSDLEDIGVDYSEVVDYQNVLSGEVRAFEWYYPQLGNHVLEVAVPLFYGDEIIGIAAVGISMDETERNVILLTVMFILLAFIISVGFYIIQRKNVIKPVMMLNKDIQLIETKQLSFQPLEVSENKSFAGLYDTINELLAKLRESFNQNKHLNQEIEEMAYKDYLTKLPNRFSLSKKFNKLVKNNELVSIVLLDLDNFKEFNDTKGHLYGDQILVVVSERLKELDNDQIFISRFGGDEFLLLFSCHDELELKRNIYDLEKIISQPFIVQKEEVVIEASIGISLYPKDDIHLNGLISKADIAMYQAKISGKNQSTYFTESLKNSIVQKNNIQEILRYSIKNKRFKLLYQPQVDVQTGEIIGFEALIRLKDNSISPNEFITIAEEKGLIGKIGRFVIEEAILQLSKWKGMGLDLKPIAINFSAKQLSDKGVTNYIDVLLKRYNIPPQYLDIEITESILLDDDCEAINFINRLKGMGVKVSLDDFGTGYSSLKYLSKFPVDKMKLDKSFIDQYLNQSGKKIIKQLILLAEAFDLDVVVEGVETIEQVRLLQDLKCKIIQGYYFSKPLKAEEIIEIYSKKFDVGV
ncbi:hypothetical protein BKP45_13455 [Anaerobacillus alkalidiazotrophicus]|uniref:GGDEF-domain containing protein n=1 Tax=Anaerobacillus alkalidiazotrophicus TaxID=472963 RepID=A0A1S2M707_9BACI|nr:EAL domain-containing protein [Anaerobacillus alkalidiazotrophicus]OIJ19445.1 hypothetical protein BKP45_13455 [Anaerobacillus alkalidiazotrophicus]